MRVLMIDDELFVRRTYTRFTQGIGPVADDYPMIEYMKQYLIDQLNRDVAEKGWRIEVPAIARLRESFFDRRFAIAAEAIVLLTPRQDIVRQLEEARLLLVPFKWWRLHNWKERRWLHKKQLRNVHELEQILREMDATGAK